MWYKQSSAPKYIFTTYNHTCNQKNGGLDHSHTHI
jgi:hypothetical protein